MAHEYKGVYGFQRSVLPCRHLRHDLFAELAYELRRYFHIVQGLDLFGNVLLAHATGIKANDLLLYAVSAAVVLPYDPGLIFTFVVTGNLDVHFTKLGFHGLFAIAVAVILWLRFDSSFRHPLTFFIAKLLVQFAAHNLIEHIRKQLFHGGHHLCRTLKFLAHDKLFQ